jgi:pimeloyl-ACP methyl ester carboxylesterase
MHDHTIKTANTNLELNYRTWGAHTAPPLVLIHGLASTLRIWDFVAPILAESYFVLAYDQRGHALSGKPDTGYNLPTMLADLVGFIDALHIKKPVVVGHSWGANLALAYAASYPGGCAGLALIDGGIYDFQDVPGTSWENVRRDLAPPDLSRYKLTDMTGRLRGGALSRLPSDFIEEYARSIMNVQPDGTIRARLTLERHLDILHILYDMRSSELLARVKCPVLAVQAVDGESANERGAQFIRMKKQGAERAQKLLPQAKIVWMENTIHDIPLQRPETLAREILEFFPA